jgi:hypothetical protein
VLVQAGSDEAGRDQHDVWFFMSGCLVLAAVLDIAAQVVQVFGFQGTLTRDRIFSVAEAAGVFPALLVVVAIAIMRTRGDPPGWPVSVARAVAAVVVLGSIYGLWYVIFVRTVVAQPDVSQSYIAFVTQNSAYRWSGVLRFVSAGVIALGVLRFASWSPASSSDTPAP